MINLMPDDTKKQLRAARRNVVLTHYIGIIALASLFLLLLIFGSHMVLARTQESAKQLIATNDEKADVYSSTEAQVSSLGDSLSEARSILNDEILYSKVLMNIGQLMPPGTVLDRIDLDAGSFTGTPVQLTIYAKTTQETVTLQNNFKASPLFTDVTFQKVSDNAGIDGYPVSANMTLLLNREAAQ